ncbi:unnamed protein product [Dovyalis caffra]|uniref:MO25-like protein At5g47540 n=1 Tax=Dovyalis caffra TaxID=77055 RepID=A0AAV1SRH9_9ROSI|nr:unnamed protein product [Dovyalis caffra]
MGFFKSKPKRTAVEILRQTRSVLIQVCSSDLHDSKKQEALAKNIMELKSILYGSDESDPVPKACAQLTEEFFRENTLRLLIICLPKLTLEAQRAATQVVANLQLQKVQSRLIASEYSEKNTDVLDLLVAGYENIDMAIHYGAMLRGLPYFDVAADAAATFKELLTRHKYSLVADFLSKNYEWFFAEFNSKLLESTDYITRRQAIKLLGDILLDRSNSVVTARYVRSSNNLRIVMNLLRDSSKSIPVEALHVFKLFAANQNKPSEIVTILVANRSKLLRFLADFKTVKKDERFEVDKAQVVKEIVALEPRDHSYDMRELGRSLE